MNSLALTTDGRSIAAVERSIRRYLPGLDVRLQPYSPRQALLPGHLARALRIEYGPVDVLLARLGVARAVAVDDAEVVALLRLRDERDLAPRRPLPRPRAALLDRHLETCAVDRAWALFGGPDGIDWSGARVGQVDTGYTRHPAFGGASTWIDTRMAETFVPSPPPESPTTTPPEPGKGLDNLIGFNAGHGTKTGSTIAGRAAESGFSGVAPRVPFVPVRICDFVVVNDRQAQFDLAVRHLVDSAGVQVINVSLGLVPPTPTKALKRAVDHAYDRGVVMVCAAGNHVRDVVPPARLKRTLAIGGTTLADLPWSGSSFGPEVDLSAPAADIRSAATSREGRFGYDRDGDGTSYAAAMVSGAAALWFAHHRGRLAARYPQPWQVVEAFRTVARSTARRPPGWQLGSHGDGILDVRRLLDAPLPAPEALTRQEPNA